MGLIPRGTIIIMNKYKKSLEKMSDQDKTMKIMELVDCLYAAVTNRMAMIQSVISYLVVGEQCK